MKTHTNLLTFHTIVGVSLITLPGAFSQATPPVQPSVDRVQKPGRHHKKHEAMLQNLTEAERAQLKAAKKQIHGDPQLVAAMQAVKDAQSKEAREEAIRAKQQLKCELLLKADPSLQPVLDKLTTHR